MAVYDITFTYGGQNLIVDDVEADDFEAAANVAFDHIQTKSVVRTDITI